MASMRVASARAWSRSAVRPAIRSSRADSVGAAVAASLEAQAALGVPEELRRPLPAAVASSLVERVNGEGGTAGRLRQLEGFAAIGDQRVRDLVTADLEQAGMAAGSSRVTDALAEGDRASASTILDAISTKVDVDREAKKGIEDELNIDDISGEREMAALWTGDSRLLQDRDTDVELVKKVAQARVAAGMSPADAVEQARKAVTRDRKSLVRSNLAAVSLPKDADADEVADGLAAIRDGLPQTVGADVLRERLGLGEGVFADKFAEALIEDFSENARWLDHPDGGYGLMVRLPDGRARWMPGRDGAPIRVLPEEAIAEANRQRTDVTAQSSKGVVFNAIGEIITP